MLLIRKDKKAAIATAVIHGFTNTILLLLFGIFAYRGWQHYPEMNMPQMATLIIKAVSIIILFVGNFLGGKLILNHHSGIKNINT